MSEWVGEWVGGWVSEWYWWLMKYVVLKFDLCSCEWCKGRVHYSWKRLFLRVIFLSSCVISASLIGILIGKLVQNNTFDENMSSIYLSLYIDPDTKTLFLMEQRACITVPPSQRKTQKCCKYVHTVMPDCSSGTHACVHVYVCVLAFKHQT